MHMFATDVHEAARLPPVTQFKPAQVTPWLAGRCLAQPVLTAVRVLDPSGVAGRLRHSTRVRAALLPAHPGLQPSPGAAQSVLHGVRPCLRLPVASHRADMFNAAVHRSIPAKLSASAEGQLAFVSYSEVGCVVCSSLTQLLQLQPNTAPTTLCAQRAEPGHGAVALQGRDGVHCPPRGVKRGAGMEGRHRQGGAHGAGACTAESCRPCPLDSDSDWPPTRVCRASAPPSCSPSWGARGSDTDALPPALNWP